MEEPEVPVKPETLENQNGDSESVAAKPQKKKLTKKVTKRKKVQKEQQNSSDDENDDTEEQGRSLLKPPEKKKRKKKSKKTFERRNIKSLLTENQLEESTKNALAEEQQRLARLQQAQRDAFANEVLEEFDLGQFKTEEDLQHEPDENQPEIKHEQPKKELIELSSDEEHRKIPPDESMLKAEDSDSSDIQIVEEVDDNVDDPDNSGMHTNDKLNNRTSEGKVIVNISEKNPNEVIHVADSIEAVIKPHQIGGVRFLYDNIIESPSVYEKSQGFGCILAHAMGLGKTLQVVTFSEVFLKATKGNHVLIIVPINTLQNWVSEFKHWLPHQPFKVHLLSDSLKTIQQRANVILNWKKEGGVLMIGYELFRLLAGTKAQQRKKKAPKKPVCIDIEEEDKAKDILIGKNIIKLVKVILRKSI